MEDTWDRTFALARQVASAPSGSRWLELLPDGSRVAYATRKSLVVAEADGSNPQVVLDNWAWNPVLVAYR